MILTNCPGRNSNEVFFGNRKIIFIILGDKYSIIVILQGNIFGAGKFLFSKLGIVRVTFELTFLRQARIQPSFFSSEVKFDSG